MKPHAHMKMVVAIRAMKGSIVAILNIRKDTISFSWMFGFEHSQDMHNHHVDHLYLSISLGVEGS
jgi:hypothetical protein